MRRPPRGVEVHADRFAADEQREADEEAILDALDVGQPSLQSTRLRTGGARRVSNRVNTCVLQGKVCNGRGLQIGGEWRSRNFSERS